MKKKSYRQRRDDQIEHTLTHQMKDHTLIQASKAPMEAWWMCKPTGEYCMSSLIIFSPIGIILTGDLRATTGQAIAALGYHKDWFVGLKNDPDYLCSKFLQSSLQNELVAEVGRELILERRRERYRRLTKEQARELWDACEDVRDGCMPHYEFGSKWCNVFGDYPNFGDDYHPAEAHWLIIIQRKFRELYLALEPS